MSDATKLHTYYFKHHLNMLESMNIIQMMEKHGWEGYGIFMAVLELLAKQKSFSLTLAQINAWCKRNAIDIRVCKSIITKYEIFVLDENQFYHHDLKADMEGIQDYREMQSRHGKEGGLKSAESRKKKTKLNLIQAVLQPPLQPTLRTLLIPLPKPVK
ncbi:DUF4373 domain-containing protein [Reichenbachiella carrageenanivorans]|uniref:DUF4373 domain-containing protein n=2 Tax=Reichenbachiella carrageenanivorans TaxID=2979869 RepID=A0ABY6CVS6_9BACT|nr:DUF4373 domain-containing protein [Reichenbachiella carrageenanivorans]UXX78011.1 DUF4373 domain-containing protein [Reichenbachiella carrageenanivorans]